MKYLLIDTCTSNVTISIVVENKILYAFNDKIICDMSSQILPIIDKGLKENNLTINDIEKILVINGPGSFTGIRIGVTIAKIIAWSLNIPVVPISSLEFLATTETNKKYIVPMIDARRGNVFAGIYDKNLKCIKNDQLIGLNTLLESIDDNYELVSYDVINCCNPKVDILKLIMKHKNDKGVNPHMLYPNYLKLTEAEEKKKNDIRV